MALGADTSADIVRLSTRTVNRRVTICALIGVPGKPAGKMFETAEPAPRHTEGWVQLGLTLGKSAVVPWLDPESQRRAQEAAALGKQDVWGTHEIEDLAQDAVDEWEGTWRAHLHGKLHAIAKAELIKTFSSAMMKLITAQTGTDKADRMAKVRAGRKKKAAEVEKVTHGGS